MFRTDYSGGKLSSTEEKKRFAFLFSSPIPHISHFYHPHVPLVSARVGLSEYKPVDTYQVHRSTRISIFPFFLHYSSYIDCTRIACPPGLSSFLNSCFPVPHSCLRWRFLCGCVHTRIGPLQREPLIASGAVPVFSLGGHPNDHAPLQRAVSLHARQAGG